MEKQNDFTQGSISSNIMRLAFPMMAAQLINVLYSVVDRVYIGHLPDASTLALTGLGLTFPIIMIITAFANLFGMGGAPLCSIARGKGDDRRAERIMGNSFAMLLITGVLLMIVCLIFKRPILYAFGASDQTFPYADDYVEIYLCGSLFVMIGLGMNSFISSDGCKLNTLKESQRLAPLTPFPIPGISTSTSRNSVMTNRSGAYFCHVSTLTRKTISPATSPSTMKMA